MTKRIFNIGDSEKSQSQFALTFASEEERNIGSEENVQVVLVSVEQLSQLRRAYPNYFMDVAYFEQMLAQIMKGGFPDPIASDCDGVAD